MRHYEIVFLVHPDQSEQVAAMIDRYGDMVRSSGGTVHRLEDWGRRQLTHSIAKLHKAHYVMMNVECPQSALEEILGAFKFSDAVLRHLVIKRDKAITEPSPLAKTDEPKEEVPKLAEPRKEEPRKEEPGEVKREAIPAAAADTVSEAAGAEAESAEAESAEAESAEAESKIQSEAPAESEQDADKTDADS